MGINDKVNKRNRGGFFLNIEKIRINLGNGINLNIIKDNKFKSNLLTYYFVRELNRRDSTRNTLLTSVLKRGNRELENTLELEKKLEEMYGANLSIGISKRGERQVLRFGMEWVKDEFVKEDGLNKKAIDLLRSIIYDPKLKGESFDENIIIQEKEILKRKIENKINDKRSYGINRCIEEMCKSEKFSIYPLGYVEDLDNIDGKNLYEHYKKVIGESPIEIFFIGEINDEDLEYLKNINKVQRQNINYPEKDLILSGIQEKKYIKEEMEINQGKLVLGLRTGIEYTNPLYYSMIMANEILGGGPNSKLFKNVREKESLAYYISSSIFKYKALMLIDSGIEIKSYDKTLEIINKEIENFKKGDFTQEDIDIAREGIKTSLRLMGDNIFSISEFLFNQELSGEKNNVNQIIQEYDRVDRDKIIEAINMLELDTIYFLKDRG